MQKTLQIKCCTISSIRWGQCKTLMRGKSLREGTYSRLLAEVLFAAKLESNAPEIIVKSLQKYICCLLVTL